MQTTQAILLSMNWNWRVARIESEKSYLRSQLRKLSQSPIWVIRETLTLASSNDGEGAETLVFVLNEKEKEEEGKKNEGTKNKKIKKRERFWSFSGNYSPAEYAMRGVHPGGADGRDLSASQFAWVGYISPLRLSMLGEFFFF